MRVLVLLAAITLAHAWEYINVTAHRSVWVGENVVNAARESEGHQLGPSSRRELLQFPNIMIPAGSIITEAYVSFLPRVNSQKGPFALSIDLELGASAPYGAPQARLANRTFTSSSVDWTVGKWRAGQRGAETRTPNLASLLALVLLTPSWGRDFRTLGVRFSVADDDDSGTAKARQVVADQHQLFVAFRQPSPQCWTQLASNTSKPCVFPFWRSNQWNYGCTEPTNECDTDPNLFVTELRTCAGCQSSTMQVVNSTRLNNTVPVGTPCVFPFFYAGQWHQTCTSTNASVPWCCATAYCAGPGSATPHGACNATLLQLQPASTSTTTRATTTTTTLAPTTTTSTTATATATTTTKTTTATTTTTTETETETETPTSAELAGKNTNSKSPQSKGPKNASRTSCPEEIVSGVVYPTTALGQVAELPCPGQGTIVRMCCGPAQMDQQLCSTAGTWLPPNMSACFNNVWETVDTSNPLNASKQLKDIADALFESVGIRDTKEFARLTDEILSAVTPVDGIGPIENVVCAVPSMVAWPSAQPATDKGVAPILDRIAAKVVELQNQSPATTTTTTTTTTAATTITSIVVEGELEVAVVSAAGSASVRYMALKDSFGAHVEPGQSSFSHVSVVAASYLPAFRSSATAVSGALTVTLHNESGSPVPMVEGTVLLSFGRQQQLNDRLLRDLRTAIALRTPGLADTDIAAVWVTMEGLAFRTVTDGYGMINGSLSCAWWDYQRDDWSDMGCDLAPFSEGAETISCICSHLTSFSLIFRPNDLQPPSGDSSSAAAQAVFLRVLMLTGTGVSLLGLVITLFCLLVLWRDRAFCTARYRIHAHLSLSLGGTYVWFLIATQRVADTKDAFCVATGMLLHYFVLACFAWMLAEAVGVYLRIVQVLPSAMSIEKFYRNYLVAAWMLPAAVVAVVATTTELDYRNQAGQCVLVNQPAIYGSVIAPVALLMLVNVVVFVRAVHVMRLNKQASGRNNAEALRIGVIMFFLLGLNWCIGLAVAAWPLPVWNYLFAITTVIQGWLLLYATVWRSTVLMRVYAWMIGKYHDTDRKRKFVYIERRRASEDRSTPLMNSLSEFAIASGRSSAMSGRASSSFERATTTDTIIETDEEPEDENEDGEEVEEPKQTCRDSLPPALVPPALQVTADMIRVNSISRSNPVFSGPPPAYDPLEALRKMMWPAVPAGKAMKVADPPLVEAPSGSIKRMSYSEFRPPSLPPPPPPQQPQPPRRPSLPPPRPKSSSPVADRPAMPAPLLRLVNAQAEEKALAPTDGHEDHGDVDGYASLRHLFEGPPQLGRKATKFFRHQHQEDQAPSGETERIYDQLALSANSSAASSMRGPPPARGPGESHYVQLHSVSSKQNSLADHVSIALQQEGAYDKLNGSNGSIRSSHEYDELQLTPPESAASSFRGGDGAVYSAFRRPTRRRKPEDPTGQQSGSTDASPLSSICSSLYVPVEQTEVRRPAPVIYMQRVVTDRLEICPAYFGPRTPGIVVSTPQLPDENDTMEDECELLYDAAAC